MQTSGTGVSVLVMLLLSQLSGCKLWTFSSGAHTRESPIYIWTGCVVFHYPLGERNLFTPNLQRLVLHKGYWRKNTATKRANYYVASRWKQLKAAASQTATTTRARRRTTTTILQQQQPANHCHCHYNDQQVAKCVRCKSLWRGLACKPFDGSVRLV